MDLPSFWVFSFKIEIWFLTRMVMLRVTLAEASAQLAQLVEAALQGEEIVIVRDEQPAVKLMPMLPVKRHRKPGSAKGLITISDDFDAPLEDFKDYME
jgi:prevent-host-death family protein